MMIAAQEKTQNQESLPTSLQDVDFMDVFISETGKVFFRGTDKQETLLPALSNAVLEQIIKQITTKITMSVGAMP